MIKFEIDKNKVDYTMDGMVLDLIPEACTVIRQLYKSFYSKNPEYAESFKNFVLKHPEVIFSNEIPKLDIADKETLLKKLNNIKKKLGSL
jgi:hypothetical protein